MREPGVELGEGGWGELVQGERAFGVLVCLGGVFGSGRCNWERLSDFMQPYVRGNVFGCTNEFTGRVSGHTIRLYEGGGRYPHECTNILSIEN